MRRRALHWLGGALVLAASACGAEPVAIPDATVDPTVHYFVGLGYALPGITVVVNGVVRAITATGEYQPLRVAYEKIAVARASPLFHVETFDGDGLVEAIDVGFGACEDWCATEDLDCAGQETESESVAVFIAADGTFLDFADDPRRWRGVGCMFCEFADGPGFVVCT
jgi:hypothetical protein